MFRINVVIQSTPNDASLELIASKILVIIAPMLTIRGNVNTFTFERRGFEPKNSRNRGTEMSSVGGCILLVGVGGGCESSGFVVLKQIMEGPKLKMGRGRCRGVG